MLNPASLFERAKALEEAAFVAELPDSVLVIPHFREISANETTSPTLLDLSGSTDSILAIKKRPGANMFALMVTVGRSANNDLQLSAGTVSKFHAYFLNAAGQIQLVDSGSRHGTFVNGERLEQRRKRTLHDGDRLVFGKLATTYYTPAGLRSYLLSNERGTWAPWNRDVPRRAEGNS